jgi:hypothetical protein
MVGPTRVQQNSIPSMETVPLQRGPKDVLVNGTHRRLLPSRTRRRLERAPKESSTRCPCHTQRGRCPHPFGHAQSSQCPTYMVPSLLFTSETYSSWKKNFSKESTQPRLLFTRPSLKAWPPAQCAPSIHLLLPESRRCLHYIVVLVLLPILMSLRQSRVI